jgi:hypothetical protein
MILGMKTPEFYKKITFVDECDSKQHGLVVQKIKGAEEIRLTVRNEALSRPLFQQFLTLVCCHKSFWQNP